MKTLVEKFKIQIWLGFLFIIRLFGITNPPLETGHNWRQSLTASIARNFLEVDPNLFFPRVDIAGDLTGILGSEFPIFNFLIYLMSAAFGYEHWYGRLINLVVSSVGIWAFYELIRKTIHKETAVYSAVILSVSIFFCFTRKIIPDTFSVSLILLALYFSYLYFVKGKWLHLIGFFLFSALGLLSKIPSLAIYSGLIYYLFFFKQKPKRVIALYSAATLSVILTFTWYFFWVPSLLKTYRFQLYFPKSFSEGIQEILPLWNLVLEKFYFSAFLSFAAFAFLLVGTFFLWKQKSKALKLSLGVVTLIFFAFIIKTGSVFPLHNYYVIPFVPVMAFIAGIGIQNITFRWKWLILLIIIGEGIANQQHDFFINSKNAYKLNLELLLQQEIPGQDLIIINGGLSHTDMYFAHRKGWSLDAGTLEVKDLKACYEKGAKYYVEDKHKTKTLTIDAPPIYSSTDYVIYDLQVIFEPLN